MGTAKIKVNPAGLASTDNGYISSITVRYNGADNALTPDGSGDISIDVSLTGANAAVTRLVGGQGGVAGPSGQRFVLVQNPGA